MQSPQSQHPPLVCIRRPQVTRPSDPWEYSDGAVYLVRELCAVDSERGVQLFEEMADIARLTHFVQADSLRETIWKQVMVISCILNIYMYVLYYIVLRYFLFLYFPFPFLSLGIAREGNMACSFRSLSGYRRHRGFSSMASPADLVVVCSPSSA